jgi:hypothetical protein
MKEPYCPTVPPTPPEQPFYLEAVIVCAFYSDFLRETLPHNKQMFDKVVVVTSPEDKATRKLCEFHHVECVVTDDLRTRWDEFCKGAGINAGLAKLEKKGWVLHLDADIWLPPQTRVILSQLKLAKETLYGIDRFIVHGYEAWAAFRQVPQLQHETNSWVHLKAFPLGTRVMSGTGYVPIGFFQMWCPEVSCIDSYIEGHTTAAREDGLFAEQWPRNRRALLPEIVGYHLESDDAVMAANWGGRTTKEFK